MGHAARRCALDQRALEVRQHAIEDRNRPNGCKEGWAEPRRVLELSKARDATFVVERDSAVEGVVPTIRTDSDQEMTGHADAVQFDAATTPELDHEHRERDGDPEPAIEDDVEVRVVRVGIVDGVSRVSEFGEQFVRERIGLLRIERRGKRVELRATLVDVEVGTRVGGDEETRFVESDVRLRAMQKIGESLGWVHEADRSGRRYNRCPWPQVWKMFAKRRLRASTMWGSASPPIARRSSTRSRPRPDLSRSRRSWPDAASSRRARCIATSSSSRKPASCIASSAPTTSPRWELAEDLTGHHHHLICASCGHVEDVPASAGLERSVAAAAAAITRTTGFRTQRHRVDLVGVCKRCG